MNDFIALLRGAIYRFKTKLFNKNICIKKGLKIYKRLRIEGPGKVNIGKDFMVNGIKGDASKYVTIDTHSKNAVISIGDNVSLYASRVSSNYAINIGNNVLVEESGIVDTDFHSIDKQRGDPVNENATKCKIKIGDNVSIGAYSVITKGVEVGSNVIIGPASVVTMPVKSNSFVMGNPARIVKN